MSDLEGRVRFLEESMDDRKEAIQELRAEIKQLPEAVRSVVKTEVQSAIRWCRKHPRKPKKPAENPVESSEDKNISRTWNRAAVTALIVLIGIVVVWAKNASGGAKDASNKQTVQTQDK